MFNVGAAEAYVPSPEARIQKSFHLITLALFQIDKLRGFHVPKDSVD